MLFRGKVSCLGKSNNVNSSARLLVEVEVWVEIWVEVWVEIWVVVEVGVGVLVVVEVLVGIKNNKGVRLELWGK